MGVFFEKHNANGVEIGADLTLNSLKNQSANSLLEIILPVPCSYSNADRIAYKSDGLVTGVCRKLLSGTV